MIFGKDLFHGNRTLEYFEIDRKNTPIAVRLPLARVLSGPLSSPSGLLSTCFKVVSQIETDSELADQTRAWYDIEPYKAYKQVHPRSAAYARAQKIF